MMMMKVTWSDGSKKKNYQGGGSQPYTDVYIGR